MRVGDTSMVLLKGMRGILLNLKINTKDVAVQRLTRPNQSPWGHSSHKVVISRKL